MIRSRVAFTIWSLALTAGTGIAGARFDDRQPEDVLKSHGLSVKRGGSTYVLTAETEVQSKLNGVQKIFKQLSLSLRQQYDFEQEVVWRRKVVPQLVEEQILIKQRLRAIARQDVVTHNQLVGRHNEINDQLRLLDVRTGDPRVKQDIDKGVSQRRAAYIQAVLELRELVDSTTRRYDELGRDNTVKNALAALASSTKSPVKLGPSRGFDENVKQLASREKSVLSKAIEMRRQGGVFEIDVTLNGKVTTPMIFDTGASLITLPADFAAKIGLYPQAADPTIQLHDATGGVTEAKKMTISSVRVGPFTVNDVDCAVMPPSKRDVPLLLGQSFINQFTHKVESGRLLLSKVEAPEQTKAARTPKKMTKTKRSSKTAPATNAPAVTTEPDSSL